MPSTAFGPLIEPGWPDLKGPDLAGRFLAGAQLGASINAKSRALENQLAHYALQAQMSEKDRELDYAKFGLAQTKMELGYMTDKARLELAGQRAEDSATHFSQMYELGKMRNDLNSEDNRLALRKYEDALEGKGDFVSAQATLAEQGLYPGMKGYVEKFDEIMGPAKAKVPTQLLNGWQRVVYGNHNNSANKVLQDYAARKKDLMNDISNTVWGTLDTDVQPILHPELLKKETTSRTLSQWWGGEQAKDTGRVLVSNAVGTVKDRPVATAELKTLKERWDKLQEEYKNLPSMVNKPELGVWAPGQNWHSPPAPIPPNKADLRLDQPYQSNKGVMRWTGDKFIPW